MIPLRIKNFFTQFGLKYVASSWQNWIIYYISRGQSIEKEVKGFLLIIDKASPQQIQSMKNRLETLIKAWDDKVV